MARSSSPLPPLAQLGIVPRTPSLGRGRMQMSTEEMDELAGDTIPCSPSVFMKDRDATQATQVLSRPGLTLAEPSSPAPSVIEVPASSPFQPKAQQTRLGSRLAPAGTVFRPPPRPQAVPAKRPTPEPINLISDDEDDLTPPRGNIRPTTFKAQIAAFAYKPSSSIDEKETSRKLRQIFDVFGDRYPSDKVREALRTCRNDLDDAIAWLERHVPRQTQTRISQPASKLTNRRLVSKGQMLGLSKPASRASSPSVASIPSSPPKPQPPPPRRRLMQGLKRRASTPPEPEVEEIPAPPSSDDPLIIDLVDDGREDSYQAEESPPASQEDDDKVLACINESSVQELAAMTGMKEDLLKPIIDKRPFYDLNQARRVSVNKKPGARKSARISIGETVVDAVEVFMDAVTAIDQVVAKCEVKGQAVKGVVEAWDLNMFGQNKRSTRSTPSGDDGPPTPTSLSSTKYAKPLVPRQPQLMDGHCVMKPFQLYGLNWMSVLYNYDIGCILADEMGLGKTCQVISFMCHLVEEEEKHPKDRRPWPNLIVVPPSTYNNWLGEFKKFAPGLSVIGYRGSQAERAEIGYMVEQDPEAYHVVLATYSQINSEEDIAAMRSFDLNAAIFDEGHKMKNPETKIYKDLRRIPSAWKMLLTGTPVQNNLLEMTSLLNFINPRLFDGYMNQIQYIFSQKVTIRDVTNGAFLYSERVKRARTILEPFILQRRKDQVLSDMPRKICTVVHCDMPETQKDVYDEYEELFKMEPSQRTARASRGRQNDQNNVWIQLRKAALHPLLFRRHFSDDKVTEMAKILMDRLPQSELHQPDIKHLIQELKNSSDFELHLWCRDYPRLLKEFDIPATTELDSGKVRKLMELIKQYQENGDRVLVFSKFSRIIELLQEVLARQDIDHRVLMGNTNVSERQTLIDEFNQDASIPVFLLTTGAGGTGINLTSANKVIIFDQSDNPQDDIQAENRAHRLGQKRDVEVIRLISAHTIEELIYKACQKKIELANKVTGAIEEDAADASKNLEQEVRKMMEEKMTPP
ncbi:helicase [Trichoderma arundinaceum]|uniref:Helicase n=1 Tax=Trichoderma arundinaceum TaxID=490622 RepID=A0A395N9M6_TRIAR|nr:helicase [Trichoderma arundinaceum]